jgi:hypothetical protein
MIPVALHRRLPFAGAILAALALALAGAGSSVGQSSLNGSGTTETSPYLEPPPDAGDGSDGGPSVAFRVITEISLPGPLPGAGPRLVEGRLLTPVSGGIASSGWDAAAEVVVSASPPDPQPGVRGEPRWSVAPDGRIRVTVLESGHLLAQKRCKRCRAGWRKKWKLRLAGSVTAPPLVTEERVYFGALDNRVYSLKRKNGHRVWEVDVQGRASREILRWQGAVLPAGQSDERPWEGEPLDVLLVVPDHGTELFALDARSGAKVASYDLADDEGRLIGAPALTPDGKIVVARQKYAPEDASLMVFELVGVDRGGDSAESDI